MFAKKNLNNSKIDKAFCGALIIALTGFFFPFIVALLTTLAENPKVFFKQILFSSIPISMQRAIIIPSIELTPKPSHR